MRTTDRGVADTPGKYATAIARAQSSPGGRVVESREAQCCGCCGVVVRGAVVRCCGVVFGANNVIPETTKDTPHKCTPDNMTPTQPLRLTNHP